MGQNHLREINVFTIKPNLVIYNVRNFFGTQHTQHLNCLLWDDRVGLLVLWMIGKTTLLCEKTEPSL